MSDCIEYESFVHDKHPLAKLLFDELKPLLLRLDSKMDRRLVRSFWRLCLCLICLREVPLKMTCISLYLCCWRIGASAWVKRLGNLFCSPKWSHFDVEQSLIRQALELFQQARGKEPILFLWDDSVWEKPSTEHSDELCSVISSKAQFLRKYRQNFKHKVKGIVRVPGLNWSMVCVATSTKVRVLYSDFWTTRGAKAMKRRKVHQLILGKVMSLVGREGIHVFDRGYSGWPWLSELLEAKVNFIIRWNTKYLLCDEKGKRRLDYIMGKKALGTVELRDAVRKKKVNAKIRVKQVYHPNDPNTPLWLVSCKRAVKGQKAWYLLTNQRIETFEQAWQVVRHYARRWSIETQFKTMKSTLQIQSIQLKERQACKLRAIVALLLNVCLKWIDEEESKKWIKQYNPRRGKAAKEVKVSMYQLKGALQVLWQRFGLSTSEKPNKQSHLKRSLLLLTYEPEKNMGHPLINSG